MRRGLSAGQESTPKGRRHRFVPLSTPAAAALARLVDRGEFVEPDDCVLANRFGRRLDDFALRLRYKRGCKAAGLRPVKLGHSAGSLIARTNDPVFVRDFLGHAKLSTADRYLGAKLRPEDFARLDRIRDRRPCHQDGHQELDVTSAGNGADLAPAMAPVNSRLRRRRRKRKDTGEPAAPHECGR